MASEVDICNLALAHIGNKAIILSLTEGSAEADHCKRFYPIARDTVLEMHRWNFATKRADLAALTETVPAWQYAYAVPSDSIKNISVLKPESTDDEDTQPYTIEALDDGSGVIYTNVEQAVLIYTRRVTDTTKFTQLAVNAISRLLAAYIAGPITKDPDVVKQQYAAFNTENGWAKASDSNMKQDDSYNNFVPAGIAARRS